MGAAARAPALTPAALPYVARALERADRASASLPWLALRTAVIAALWVTAGPKGQLALRGLLAAWWLLLVAKSVAVRVPQAPLPLVWLDAAIELAGSAATLAAIVAADALTTPVWLVAFARSFEWWPRRRPLPQIARWGIVVTHLALAASWFASGRGSAAVVVLAFATGWVIVHEVSSKLVQQRLEVDAEGEALHVELERLAVRRENDRIARELHDGLGADLVGLMLALRAHGPAAAPQTEQVVALLEELRSVVWALRGGRGSLAEFEKLVRARARMTWAKPGVLTHLASQWRTRAVEPEDAVALVSALHEVLAVGAPDASRLGVVEVTIDAEPTLSLRLRFQDASRDALQAIVAGLPPDSAPRVAVAPDDALRITLPEPFAPSAAR